MTSWSLLAWQPLLHGTPWQGRRSGRGRIQPPDGCRNPVLFFERTISRTMSPPGSFCFAQVALIRNQYTHWRRPYVEYHALGSPSMKSGSAGRNGVQFLFVSRSGGMVYAHDSKSCVARHVGSSPTSGINKKAERF